MSARVLIADDESKYLRVLEVLLADEGYEILKAPGGREALDALDDGDVDVILTDLQMPGVGGLEVLEKVRAMDPDLPVIIITAYGTIDSAVEATRMGAFDFVQKPFEAETLKLQIAHALEHRRLRTENRRLLQALSRGGGFRRILGESGKMRRAKELAATVAGTDSTVLLLGESGTGKELFARAIHEASPRRAAPFVKINCAAIPESLLESELFGVERGAFTGADRSRKGKFAEAHRGTLFLDEIGELDVALQPKLLRALEERVVERVGGGSPEPFDVRIVAATNRNLAAAVERGEFRTDLFHRLAVFTLELPPLRRRPEDIPLLVRAWVELLNEEMGRNVTEVPDSVLDELRSRPWPGNVRELGNVIERAMILARGSVLRISADGSATAAASGSASFELPEGGVSLDALERTLIEQAMSRSNGNKTVAARLLGINRGALRYRLEKLGLESSESRDLRP